jgi:hypothetical protein
MEKHTGGDRHFSLWEFSRTQATGQTILFFTLYSPSSSPAIRLPRWGDIIMPMTWGDAIQNNMLWIQSGMLLVQIFALVGLILYVKDTKGLRKAAENQITLSHNLFVAAMDQAESAARPCITLASKLRVREDALQEVYGVKGMSVVKDSRSFLGIRNIGNGLAINIKYRFNQVGPEWPKNLKGNDGYLQRLHAAKAMRLPLPASMTANGEWDVDFEFESLGGRKYQTKLTLKANVLSDFRFEQISGPTTTESPQMA